MPDIRHLRQSDLNGGRFLARYRHVPGHVFLHHLDGPAEEYRLAKWHKQVGDRVQTHDIIASIETERLVLDIEVFEGGIISECLFTAGSLVPDGAIIARIKPDKKGA